MESASNLGTARPLSAFTIPPFRPHPLVRGGHAQTLVGVYLPNRPLAYLAQRRQVELSDGDQLVLHDDQPPGWRAFDRTALLIHGLAGCHTSGYMQRIAHKLNGRGVRVFRMDLRGCGAGAGLARLPYHSGRSEDAAASLEHIARLLPASPTTLVGFSLGANITLKLLGEIGAERCGNLDSAMAVCPPVDLAAASRRISRGANRLYDRYFVKQLVTQLRLQPNEGLSVPFQRAPRTLWEFDDVFTAAVCQFGRADDYYRAASSAPLVPRIQLPTLIVAAADDPMIPIESLQSLTLPDAVRLHVSASGGHLGFVGRAGDDDDRRWLDWRVVDWVTQQDH